MSSWNLRLRRVWAKHETELRGLVAGELPGWLAPGRARVPVEVPTFVFHDAEPRRFEAYLRFLADNHYRSLTADELADLGGRVPAGERLVVLSFDDALSSFRTVAFPLLRQYGFRAVLFVVPEVLSNDDQTWPDLTDVRAGTATEADVRARVRDQPFCSWSELAEMHASGTVDVQSHSLSHHRVPISARVIDFVHPGLDLWHGNFDLPVSVLDKRWERTRRPGAPVFVSAPRLSGRTAFVERPELVRTLVDRVASEGSNAFFALPSWRRTLRNELSNWPLSDRGRFETAEETAAAMRLEIVGAREVLERRLPGAQIRHLAYPWHAGGRLADRLAAEQGKRSVLYGPSISSNRSPRLLRIRRLPESYLPRLPGRGRASFFGLLCERAGQTRWASRVYP